MVKYSQSSLKKPTVDYWTKRIKKGIRPVITVIKTKKGLVIDDGNHKYKAYKNARIRPRIKRVRNPEFRKQIDSGEFKAYKRVSYWE